MEIYIKRDWQNHLIPTNQFSLDEAKRLKEEKTYLVKVSSPRNLVKHQKFFVLINTIFEIQGFFTNITAFRYWITIKAGYFDMDLAPNGEPMYRAKSISFSKMKQEEFEKLYQKVITIALENDKICGGITEEDLLREVQTKILRFT